LNEVTTDKIRLYDFNLEGIFVNTKIFSILAIITLLVVTVAVILTQQQPTTLEQKKLFPHLMSILNEVTEINLSTKNNNLTLIRSDAQWQLKERHYYPVASTKVNPLLLGIADLRVLEAKTSNPALYSKIGLEDISTPEAKSTLLTLKKAKDETVAHLIIGKDRIAKIDSTRREIYIRKPDEKQTWLTLGQLPLEKNPEDWLEPEIINIDSDNIRQVQITHPEGERILIFRETPEDKDYRLADLPEKAKVKNSHTLNNIAMTLSHLNLDDVTIITAIKSNDKLSTRAIFTTFDGLEVTLTIVEKEDKHYAKFSAVFNETAVFVPQAPQNQTSDQPLKKADPKKQAETLNAKFKTWVYELAQYKINDLKKKRDDLISVEVETTEKESFVDEAETP